MTRKQRTAPENILLVKTTRGSWIALEEEWGEDGRLLKLNPMRRTPAEGVTQARERRDILAEVERAIAAKLSTQLRRAERELHQARSALNEINERDGPERAQERASGMRYGAVG